MDYEGSGYRQEFWEDANRSYEDAIERAVLNQLMPSHGGRLAELGAGFGRLADLYHGYKQVVLFDYSRTLLADAVARRRKDPRFLFVAGNLYEIPFAPGVFDTVIMVRVMHHLADVETALAQIVSTLHRESTVILEYANKRNVKSVVRWLARKQSWDPFSPEPVEFVPLNFDFHPSWMEEQMSRAGLQIEERVGASHFRVPVLKRHFSAGSLVSVESPFLSLSGRYPLAPSVFVRAVASDRNHDTRPVDVSKGVEEIFRCLRCGTTPLRRHSEERLVCPNGDFAVERVNQIWDFKAG